MLKPAYKLTIGEKIVDTTDEPKASTVVDLNVALDLDTPADSFALVLGNVGSLKPARERRDKDRIGLCRQRRLHSSDYRKVVTIEASVTRTRIAGFSGADALLRTFVEQTFENKTAGAIVRDLADKAG